MHASNPSSNTNDDRAEWVDDPYAVHIDLTVTDGAALDTVEQWQRDHAGGGAPDEVEILPLFQQAVHVGLTVVGMSSTSTDVAAAREVISRATERTERAVSDAASRNDLAAKAAGEHLDRVRLETTKAIDEAGKLVSTQMASVTKRVEEIIGEVFGGADSAVVAAATAAISKAMTENVEAFERRMDNTVKTVESKFDASDPASPIGKLAASIKSSQDDFRAAQLANTQELGGKVDALTMKLAEVTAARAATAKATADTSLKGKPYEDGVHEVLEHLTESMGDGYVRTGTTPGALGASKKGDGVIVIEDAGGRAGLTARVAIEMHNGDSGARNWAVWGKYLDEVARNREANVVLGIVRTQEQMPGDEPIRMFGSKKLLVVFDPASDDPALLHTLLLLMRTQACADVARGGTEQVAAAQDALDAAYKHLAQLAELQKLVGSIKTSADATVTKLATLKDGLYLHLGAALAALREANGGEAAA